MWFDTEQSSSNHLTPLNDPEDGKIYFNGGGSLRSHFKNCFNFCFLFAANAFISKTVYAKPYI
jgi:hypothetical protein